MKPTFSLQSHTVHLWHAFLPDLQAKTENYLHLLSPDEVMRAERFRFPLHRTRYILARGILREILHRYTLIPAHHIIFSYGPHGKPYLKDNALQFNVSHSHDRVVYAMTTTAEIGVDIELIESTYSDAVAKRFFNEKEYAALNALSENEKITAFYQCWAGKEALIKAIGNGLHTSLHGFSIQLNQRVQSVLLSEKLFHLEYFSVDANYQSAVATEQSIDQIIFFPIS